MPTAVESTVGAFECGVMIAMFLFGMTTVQTSTYFRNYSGDSWRMKAFVAGVWLLELAHSVLIASSIYGVTVDNPGEFASAEQPLRDLCLSSVLFAITSSTIQGFFGYRVRILTGSYIIPSICWFLSFFTLIGHSAIGLLGYNTDSLTDWKDQWRGFFGTVLAISALVDILIAVALCRCLRYRRRQGVNSSVHHTVDRLITWSLQTCLVTSIGMVSMLVLFLAPVGNFAWMTLYFSLPRLFTISFLASLNARRSLRNFLDNDPVFVDIDGSTCAFGMPDKPASQSSSHEADEADEADDAIPDIFDMHREAHTKVFEWKSLQVQWHQSTDITPSTSKRSRFILHRRSADV